MQSLLKILSQMTGLQKLGVIRNLVVLPLLLLSFTLSGGVFAFTAPIVVPWMLYMGFNLGSNSHRLQAINGFHLAPQSPKYLGLPAKAMYVLSFIAGIVYLGIIAALKPDDAGVAMPQALQVAVFGAAFFGVFLTIVGVRMGWSSVEESAPGTDPAKTLRLVDTNGVKRRQLIYLAAGIFVLIGSLSSLSVTYPRWAGDGSDTSASEAQTGQDVLKALSSDSPPPVDPKQTGSASRPRQGTPAPQQEAVTAVQQAVQAAAAQQAADQQVVSPGIASSAEDESDFPAMTPCIQHWADAYQAQRDAQGLDSTVSIDQAWEWKHWCDAGRQAPTPRRP